jgi:hypothetical protein
MAIPVRIYQESSARDLWCDASRMMHKKRRASQDCCEVEVEAECGVVRRWARPSRGRENCKQGLNQQGRDYRNHVTDSQFSNVTTFE